ncbi:MAG: hypothetical protein AAFP70_13280 [Calditrichota bacterium]
MMQFKTTTSAPGKLILIGEYAVLERAPAVVMAVNRTANVNVKSTDSASLVSAPGLNISNVPFEISDGHFRWLTENEKSQYQLRFFQAAVLEALRANKDADLAGCQFTLDTSDFFSEDNSGLKFGFGSSASLTYAIVAAVLKILEPNVAQSPQKLLPIASAAHYLAQKKLGSGIDVAAAAYGGLIEYQLPESKNPVKANVQRISWPNELYICCVFSGKSVSTRELVTAVYQLQKTNSDTFLKHMQQMTLQSMEAVEALKYEKTNRFIELVDAYGLSMQQLGESAGVSIMSAEHRQLKQLANKYGAAYKPSGAGGGDIGIAVSLSKRTIEQTAARFHEEGFLVIDLAPYYHEI